MMQYSQIMNKHGACIVQIYFTSTSV